MWGDVCMAYLPVGDLLLRMGLLTWKVCPPDAGCLVLGTFCIVPWPSMRLCARRSTVRRSYARCLRAPERARCAHSSQEERARSALCSLLFDCGQALFAHETALFANRILYQTGKSSKVPWDPQIHSPGQKKIPNTHTDTAVPELLMLQ
jgi:hypothetical protein